MDRCTAIRMMLVGTLVVGTGASAQELVAESTTVATHGQGWSVLGGKTVGKTRTALTAQLGWPGLSIGGLRGTSSYLDLGVKFTFNYGVEGVVTQVAPGIKLQGQMHLTVIERSRMSLGLHFAPGFLAYFQSAGAGGTAAGVTLPVGLVLGISAGSALQAHLAMEMPLFIMFGSFGGLVAPLLFGGGVEYFLDKDLAATFTTRLGPAVDTRALAVGTSQLAFEMLIGAQYRL